MGRFISRQPNGLLCQFSTIVDTVIDWNMTDDDYIEMCMERAKEKARYDIENNLKPFDWVKQYFLPTHNTEEEFKELVNEMSNPLKL